MKASETLRKKIKEFEGVRLTAYRCPAGVWTIGAGHTQGVRKGMRISEAQMENYLSADLRVCERYVGGLGVRLTQGQFDALVDFCFNLGTSKLAGSTLLKKVLAGAEAVEVVEQLMRWVYSGGKQLAGLVERRAWEARQWDEAAFELWRNRSRKK